MTEPEVSCGNKKHPNGPWHEATPMPMFTWRNRREVRAWKRRRRLWGCGCSRRLEDD